jgi:LacI family transcriptional regulator
VVDYLVSKGHRNIAFINGHNFAAVSRVRLDGYKLALEENGIPFTPELTIISDYSEEGAYNSTQRLLQEKKNISAIFAASDLMAVGAIKALIDSNYKVPEDISVIGFDDIFFAEYSNPGLTTVRQHKFEMGYEGSKLLNKIMEQPDYVPKRKRIDVELIIRESA